VVEIDSPNDINALNERQSRLWYAADNLGQSIDKRNLVYEDAELTAYVQSVLDRLYPEFVGTLHVELFNSPHLNAICLPNGHIYINIGLLARLDNEAQLATILAHEAAHFIRQHSAEQRNSADGTVLVGTGVEILTGIPFSGSLLAASVMSSYSQAHENEADNDGFARLVEAGYDPREASKTFHKLLEEVEVLDIDQPFMFASHPKLEHRIASFDSLMVGIENPAGRVNADDFLQRTEGLREVTLVRYMDMNNHKVLLLILENPALRQRYAAHPDFFLGEAYRLRNDEGDETLATQALRQSINTDPLYAPAYRALGLLMMKQGRKQEAIENLSTYLSLSPDASDREYIETYLQQLKS
jgi:predicted Zn-dependent protease